MSYYQQQDKLGRKQSVTHIHSGASMIADCGKEIWNIGRPRLMWTEVPGPATCRPCLRLAILDELDFHKGRLTKAQLAVFIAALREVN